MKIRRVNVDTEGLLEWYVERPDSVQSAVAIRPPWLVYELLGTGQHGFIVSYSENDDGSCSECTMMLWQPEHGYMNPLTTVQVFGILFAEMRPIRHRTGYLAAIQKAEGLRFPIYPITQRYDAWQQGGHWAGPEDEK